MIIQKKQFGIIKKNIKKTHAEEKTEVYQMTYEKLLKEIISDKLDIIYIDPPYKSDFAYVAVKLILENNLLNQDGLIIIETDQEKEIIEKINTLDIEITNQKKYGRVHLIFLKPRK